MECPCRPAVVPAGVTDQGPRRPRCVRQTPKERAPALTNSRHLVSSEHPVGCLPDKGDCFLCGTYNLWLELTTSFPVTLRQVSRSGEPPASPRDAPLLLL